MLKNVILAGAAILCATSANADVYVWDWSAGQGGAVNNAAGNFESVHAEFDSTAQKMIWNVTFSNQVTDALTFAVSDGPNPKGDPGELALIYVDWNDKSTSTAKMTAYGYNGANLSNSWLDGNGDVAGNQAPDIIHSLNDTSWITKASVTNVGTKRKFELEFSTAAINSHDPLYTGSAPWSGIQFAQKLGLWMHSFDGAYPGISYLNGEICAFGYKTEGWFDGANFPTVVPIPTSAAMGLAGLVGVFALRRRLAR